CFFEGQCSTGICGNHGYLSGDQIRDKGWRRSVSPSPQRYSSTTFWPSTKPASFKPLRNAVTKDSLLLNEVLCSHATTGMACCCPCTLSGHAAAAPPTSPMTPRRFKSRMESLLQPTGRAMAWSHSQSTAVWSISQAGRPVLGPDLNCSESTIEHYDAG